MTEKIDLQLQLEGESDKAFLAYEFYKGLGEKRTVLAAYNAYRDKKRDSGREKAKTSIPQAFSGWSKRFDWAGRVRDWDAQKKQRIQNEQLEIDRQGYLKRIEDSRAILEETATTGMKASRLSLTIAYSQLQRIARQVDRGGKDDLMDKAATSRLAVMTTTCKEAMAILSIAKNEIYDAMGLVSTIEELAEANSKGKGK